MPLRHKTSFGPEHGRLAIVSSSNATSRIISGLTPFTMAASPFASSADAADDASALR